MENKKTEVSHSASYYYILWGSIVVLHSIAQFFVLRYDVSILKSSSLLFLLGGVLSYFHAKKDKTPHSVIDKVYLKVWIGISIGLVLVNVVGPFLSVTYIIPLTLALYTIGGLITGLTSKFLPSIIGAIVCGLCTVCSFYTDMQTQFLLQGLAVASVHIIPGFFLLQKKTQAE